MSILEENILRNAKLDAYYNPYTGEGSTIERQLFEVAEFEDKLYLPMSMMNVPWVQSLGEYGNMKDFIKKEGRNYEALAFESYPEEALLNLFVDERLNQDFEYYSASCLHIQNKDTFEDFNFVLRGAQRKLLYELEEMRLAGVPIRIVLLKARQWGGSTLVDMYAFWLQQRHRVNWHMAICAQDDGAAGNISSMYDYAIENYPLPIGKLVSIKGSTKNRKDNIRGGRINIGSINNPIQFRSYNNAIVHMTETGFWEDTPKRSAMMVVSALKETVPDQPYTMVVEESTANGPNYFYDSWIKAEKGETRYKGVFIAFYEIDRCRVKVKDVDKFYSTMTDYEKYQWSLGATIEGISWYRKHKADKGYSDWMMMAENPATPEEAFQSSGQKVFPPIYIDALRKDNREPEFQGEIFADARLGEKAFDNIRFEKVPNGNLKIWEMPDYSDVYKNRYVVSVDIGGRTEKADNSLIRVIDRKNLLLSYKARIDAILTWCGHTDQDLLAWKAAQIATKYCNALLIIEGNSLETEEEGNHFQTVLDQIKDHYRNLYIRNDVEKVGSDFVPRYGWWTTHKNKSTAINALNAAARERMLSDSDADQKPYLVENDKGVCDEMSWFETKPDGKQGAVKGKRDDKVMTTAIGVQVALNEMPLPELRRQDQTRRVERTRGMSDF